MSKETITVPIPKPRCKDLNEALRSKRSEPHKDKRRNNRRDEKRLVDLD